MTRFMLTVFAFTILNATNAAAAVCVENQSTETWLFTAESDAGGRATAVLASQGRLCIEGDGLGTVAVFENAEELEGCSRRVAGDSITRMLDFPSVDLCAWKAMPSQ
jgi:hypothetical protein